MESPRAFSNKEEAKVALLQVEIAELEARKKEIQAHEEQDPSARHSDEKEVAGIDVRITSLHVQIDKLRRGSLGQ